MNALVLPQRAPAPASTRSVAGVREQAPLAARPFARFTKRERSLRPRKAALARASAEEKTGAAAPAAAVPEDLQWVPVIAPEDLPKGVRKEIKVSGRSLLLFWYRNQIYCTEARSPAEGAYSEGLIKGKFTQDFALECPTTGTLFSLKDGSIVNWYPNNPVLRALTPQCRPLELYPVKLSQDAISVSIEGGTLGGIGARGGRGGSDSSIDKNNVFYLEPKMYVEGNDTPAEDGTVVEQTTGINPVSAIVGLVAVAGLAVAGTAVGIYYESPIAVGAFWLALFGLVAYFALQQTQKGGQ